MLHAHILGINRDDISSLGRYFGVTPPLESSEWEKDDTNTLINEFLSQNLFEDAEETRRR